MEIQKIYTDGEERLYSVLISGDEMNLLQREFGKVKAANKAAKKAWEKVSSRGLLGKGVDPRMEVSAFRVGNRASGEGIIPRFSLSDRKATITGKLQNNLNTRINARGTMKKNYDHRNLLHDTTKDNFIPRVKVKTRNIPTLKGTNSQPLIHKETFLRPGSII